MTEQWDGMVIIKMGMYGSFDKDFLYDEIVKFLKEHYVSELLEMVANAVRETNEYN